MEAIICSDIPLKENNEREDKELNKTEYFEFLQKSKVELKNRKKNQIKHSSVNFVIIKVNVKIRSQHMRSQFI